MKKTAELCGVTEARFCYGFNLFVTRFRDYIEPALSGVVDAAEYKDYILVMLFLKYISDVWMEHYEILKKKFGDDDERIRRRLDRERFKLPKGCSFYDLHAQRQANNLGELINVALEHIEDQNKEKLQGVFRNMDFNSESALGQTKDRNARLKHLLEDFNSPKIDLRPSRIGDLDIIGDAYEYLISRFAAGAGKKAGEFYTPAQVSQLLAELLDPQPGERICDPACGSGSLLIKCGNQIKNKDSNDFALYGQEINGSTWALAKMNMFLHGMDSARIEWGDTIRSPKLLEKDTTMKFEVVTANPPFSLDKWGIEEAGSDTFNRFHRGLPPKSKGDYAFISHMIETITHENGRVGVVVPHGVLYRGSREGKIRQQLIDENLLDAVIGLPANLFYGTGIPRAVLIFKRNRKKKAVLFIDASREFQDGKNQNKLSNDNIQKIVKTYRKKTVIDKYSYLASLNEIKENDYNLNIPRYVDTFEEEEPVDIPAVQKEIVKLESELDELRVKMNGYLKELGF
ncbi:MAG: type I restriction-modification system subunit M [Spirochaetales bacterium]|nr:type I restriction-modification system subunit M [Spirochaetales bacterium]